MKMNTFHIASTVRFRSLWFALVTVLLFAPACTEDFLEVNDNPNALTSIEDAKLLLITGMLDAVSPYAGQFNEWSSTLVQYWSSTINQSPRRPDQWSRVEDNGSFAGIYESLKNLKEAARIAQENGQTNIYAVAEITEAFTFHYLTDVYGDLPFSEAAQGAKISKPKYDPQALIYDGLIQKLDAALAAIALNGGDSPGSADPIYSGDMNRWIAFANSLKFRIYMRQSLVRPEVAEQGIRALEGQPVFRNASEEARVTLSGSGGNTNPVFQQNGGRNTLRITGSPTLIDYMLSLNDPRLPAYFNDADANADNGIQFVGWPNGQNLNAPETGHSSPTFPIEANAPMLLMSYHELLFLKAEAAERGWWTSEGTAKELYDAAITASMDWWGVEVGDYLSLPGVDYDQQPNKLRAIGLQKWISLYGFNAQEAWFEVRRTTYPEYSGPDAIIIKPETAINDYPRRFSYSSQEYLFNSDNVNATGIPQGQDDFLVPVWWDVH